MTLEQIAKMRAVHGLQGLDADARQERARLVRQYVEVAAACAQFDWLPEMTAMRLARAYMDCVLDREQDSRWWHENGAHVTQPWFIWHYAVQNGLIKQNCIPHETEARAPRVLRPEDERWKACASIEISHDLVNCDEGILSVSFCEKSETIEAMQDGRTSQKSKTQGNTEAPEALRKVLTACGFRKKNESFERRIGEMQSPIAHRAAETAAALLDAGFRVAVWETEIERRVLSGDFEPEHRHWIGETERENRLCLLYPRDATLHHYVRMAGGVWNGRRVEIDICHADRLEELAQRYPFRVTREAQRRLNAWREAERSATIYRRQHGPQRQADPRDGFRMLLERKIELFEDLIERDG